MRHRQREEGCKDSLRVYLFTHLWAAIADCVLQPFTEWWVSVFKNSHPPVTVATVALTVSKLVLYLLLEDSTQRLTFCVCVCAVCAPLSRRKADPGVAVPRTTPTRGPVPDVSGEYVVTAPTNKHNSHGAY